MPSLIDKATNFIASGHPQELWLLLNECVDAATPEGLVAVQKLARDMYGGITFNFELKAPAAHCLPIWEAQGLDAVVDNAIDEPTSKNFSLAFQILAAYASGTLPAAAEIWLKDCELLEKVRTTVNAETLRPAAKKALNRLVMSSADPDEIALYLGIAFQSMALLEPNAIQSLFRALSLRWTAVGLPQIKEYESLVNNSPFDEDRFHAFFERNPLFLDPLAIRVWSKPDLHGKKEPDFVVQRADNTYLVVEIETPGKLLVTSQSQVSAETTHAVAQVLDYRAFLMERFAEAAAVFPHFSPPDGLVVVGLEGTLDESQLAALRRENENRPHVRVIGFDALGKRTNAITQNVIESPIVVTTSQL